jgi:hypothetical protein
MIATDTGALILSALSLVALHSATNNQYGFHRDELATIDDARFLGWGYVVYPPVTPFIARVALTLFGPSMIGLRFSQSQSTRAMHRWDTGMSMALMASEPRFRSRCEPSDS